METAQRYDGANLTGYLGGNLVGTLATTAANTTNSTLQLGSRHNVANTAFDTANGAIAEVLFFNTALSPQDRAAVEAFLNFKWFNLGAGSNILPTSTPVVFTAAGGTLDLNGVSQAIGSLSGGGNGVVALGNGTLTVGSDNTSTNFGGAITGSGGLVKVGTGALTLSGVQSYTSLVATGGMVNLNSPLGTGGSSLDVSPTAGTAEVNVATSQILSALNIGDGGVVTLGSINLAAAEAGDAAAPGLTAPDAVQAVPEPGALSLLAGGVLSLLARRRRCRA